MQFSKIQTKIRNITETPYNDAEIEQFNKIYPEVSNEFAEYKIKCSNVIRSILVVFPVVMPAFLQSVSGTSIKKMFLKWFNKPNLENFHSELESEMQNPAEIDVPKNTNITRHDFTKVTQFNDYAKLKKEHIKSFAVFIFGIALFIADVAFMAMQYGDALNDPTVGWLLACVLIIIIAILSAVSGTYYYKHYKKITSWLIFTVAIIIDLVSMFLRVFMVYSPDSDNAMPDGNLYFPFTIQDRPDSLLMSLIIGGITLFGITLTWSHAKTLFNTDFTKYRGLIKEYAEFTDSIPKFADELTSFENYATRYNIPFTRIQH